MRRNGITESGEPFTTEAIEARRKAIEARRKILATAEQMLAGKISFMEGSRIIATQSFAARLDRDPDILPFVGVGSETDALPIDAVDRSHWQKAALEALQPKIDEAESWAKTLVTPHCMALTKRLQADHG